MARKSLQTTGITLTLDGSKDKIFICHNPLLEDDQVLVKQVEQPADGQDKRTKDAEIDDDNNNNSEEEDEEEKEAVGIEFTK